MAESTSHLIVKKILTNFNKISKKFIKWPVGQKAVETVEKFNCLRPAAFQNVIGAINGCHIKILAPWVGRKKMLKLNTAMFINRKQVASIVLQVKNKPILR